MSTPQKFEVCARMRSDSKFIHIFHYLSPSIQNKFIEICGSFVLKNIAEEIKAAKHFAIAVDATPDVSRKGQHYLLQ